MIQDYFIYKRTFVFDDIGTWIFCIDEIPCMFAQECFQCIQQHAARFYIQGQQRLLHIYSNAIKLNT